VGQLIDIGTLRVIGHYAQLWHRQVGGFLGAA
jgi:hypothetical protein